MRQYKINDMGGCQSLWWAEGFNHALEQFYASEDSEEVFMIQCEQLYKGNRHCDLWDFVYDHLKHFGAIPMEYEDGDGSLWSIDDIIVEMTDEEHLLANAMINNNLTGGKP